MMLLVQDLTCRACDMKGMTKKKTFTWKSSIGQRNPSTARDQKQLSRTHRDCHRKRRGREVTSMLVSDADGGKHY